MRENSMKNMKMMEHSEDHEVSRKSVQDDESLMKMMKEYDAIITCMKMYYRR